MARQLGPFQQGEVVTMRAHGRGDALLVTTPSGIELTIPAPRGRTDLWLPELGTWTYRWSESEAETLEVVASEVVEEVAETPPVALPTGSLSVR